jgi:flagellar protein FliT
MLIDCYKNIEQSSQRMLHAAQMHDWDAVARWEGVCAGQIAHLQSRAAAEPLAAAQRREKTGILLRILRNDAQVRSLMEPWSERLEPLLSGTIGQSGGD